MKRYVTFCALIVAGTLLAPGLRADVKTRQKTQMKFEGFMGGIINRMAGNAAKEGVINTVALKGDRLARINDQDGQIIDLSEQKIYILDIKKKEYKVLTFAEMRAQMEKAKADMEKQRAQMKPEEKQQMEQAGQQLEFDADVKETGQKKTIAGHETREVILTITAHEKGKKVEESGGFALVSDMWLASKIAALEEEMQFQIKFMKAVYGESLAGDMQQMMQMSMMSAAFKPMMEKMQTEGRKMQGTALMSVVTFETVRGAEQAKSQQQQPGSGGGGGIGGMLAKRLGGNRGQNQGPRSTLFTSTSETLSIESAASAEDVAMPSGFKEKK